MNSSEKRLILPLLRRMASGDSLSGDVRTAKQALERFDKQPSTKKSAAKREKQIRKSAAKAAHAKETAAIRLACFLRAGNRCELCGFNIPTELHHLLGGSGRRRQRQAVENCMAICLLCHREYHSSPDSLAPKVAEWCKRYGYPPIRRITHAAVPEKQKRLP